MKLTLSFSPCPNDTFIFDAIVNRKIELHDLDFVIHLADVEELNQNVLEHKPDISKVSFNTFTEVTDEYQLLTAGSALGFGCGPLLITRDMEKFNSIQNPKIAIPGINTTANLLMKYAFPNFLNKIPVLFSSIEEDVLSGKYDAGVIIHENRFTYLSKGLQKVQDLGKYWEDKTGFPIPLGGIAIRKSLDQKLKSLINQILKSSISLAFANPSGTKAFVKSHAQELDDQVVRSHIDLYVNSYSLDLGEIGKDAIYHLFEIKGRNLQTHERETLFVE